MIYKEIRGNLFYVPDNYSLAQCVSIDNKWGLGIATEFDKKFKGMKNECIRIVNENNLKAPSIIYYYDDRRKQGVFNLYTKSKYYGKPTYQTITECVRLMAECCKTNNIKYLAIPKLGCGLDKLQWGRVREIIQEHFKDLDIEILLVRKK